MKKQLLFVCLSLSCCFTTALCQLPKWTIMVYMNADNELERCGIRDFLEMAEVDDSRDVNILVQMDRTPGGTDEYGDWTQTLRFKMSKGLVPCQKKALLDLGETNMGDPNTLKNFIDWCKQTYPAENYALVIWDHGDGWRYMEASAENTKLKELYLMDYKAALAADQKFRNEIAKSKLETWTAEIAAYRSEQKKLTADLNRTTSKITGLPQSLKDKVATTSDFSGLYKEFKDFVSKSVTKIPSGQLLLVDKYANTLDNILSNNTQIENLQKKMENLKITDEAIPTTALSNLKMGTLKTDPVKAVSDDYSNGDILYNKEIHDVLPDGVVNVIAFDACLMSMIETGYTLRNKASYMVGSEDLESGSGWDYALWLGDLVLNPKMTGLELSKTIVENYHKAYPRGRELTLSCIDLSLMQTLAGLMDNFSRTLAGSLSTEKNNILGARNNCLKYAPGYASVHSIDLSLFLYHLAEATTDNNIKTQSNQIRSLVNVLVVANYFSEDRKFLPAGYSYGSFGLAIYFPERKEYFDMAYTDENQVYPVEFVRDNYWDNFLRLYLN